MTEASLEYHRITVPIENVGYWCWKDQSFMLYDEVRDWLIERIGVGDMPWGLMGSHQWRVSAYDENPLEIVFCIRPDLTAVEFRLRWG